MNVGGSRPRPRARASTAAILAAASTVVIASTVVVFWFSTAPVMVEWQLTVVVLAICLCTILTVSLYRGVRLERLGGPPRRFSLPSDFDIPLDVGSVGGDGGGAADFGEGCLVALLVLALVVLAVVTVQFLLLAVPPVLYGLYRLCDRLLRYFFAASRACKGRPWRSLRLALACTGYAVAILYGGPWLVRALWIAFVRG
jgi:hypothetical protein